MESARSVAGADTAFAAHEHRELARGLERIHEAARSAGRVSSRDMLRAVDRTLDWFGGVLAPHADWEEAELYPRIDRRAGSSWATRLMRFEHRQIQSAAKELESAARAFRDHPGNDQLCEVRARLYSLEALLRAHIAREELFLLPVLEPGAAEGVQRHDVTGG